MNKHNQHPAHAEFDGEYITISIHKSYIKTLVEFPLTLDTPQVVTDIDVLAEDVKDLLNGEQEDGSTIVTKALEEAIIEAIEWGSEGVEYND